MPLLWRSSRESRSERCKRAFLLAPICKVLLAPTLVSDRATMSKGARRGVADRVGHAPRALLGPPTLYYLQYTRGASSYSVSYPQPPPTPWGPHHKLRPHS